jgi:hypothetical protein
MILATFGTFRAAFALPLAVTDNDGYPHWPNIKVRASGFDTIVYSDPVTLGNGGPMTFEVAGGVADAVTGVSDYYWYIAQRTDDYYKQYLDLSHTDHTKSSVVQLFFRAVPIGGGDFRFNRLNLYGLDKLAPPANLVRMLFKQTTIYVQRQSDKAIALLRLDALASGHAAE